MNPEDLQKVIAALEETIDKKVNGKIDRLSEKMDRHNEKHEEDMQEVRAHIVEVKPILDAYNGGKVLGNLIRWVAGVGIAAVALGSWVLK